MARSKPWWGCLPVRSHPTPASKARCCFFAVRAVPTACGWWTLPRCSTLDRTRKGQRKAPVIRVEVALSLAAEVLRPELREACVKGVEDATPDRGLISRFVWEAAGPGARCRRLGSDAASREKGGLPDLLTSLQAALGDQGAAASLGSVVAGDGRPRDQSSDLLERAADDRRRLTDGPYVRIKD